MQQIAALVNKIPPGVDMIAVGALLAFGTKQKTVQWIALGLGGLMVFLSFQDSGA